MTTPEFSYQNLTSSWRTHGLGVSRWDGPFFKAAAMGAVAAGAAHDARLRNTPFVEHYARQAIDMIATPIVLTEEDARIVLCNHSGHQLLESAQAFAASEGRLLCVSHARAFHDAIENATSRTNAHSTSLCLPQRDDEHFYALIVPFTPDARHGIRLQRRLAYIAVYHRSLLSPQLDLLLKRLFGLTNSEARVARLLSDGAVPHEVAAKLGVAVATIRCQMKAVFSKMGVRRQAEMCRMVTGIGLTAICPGPPSGLIRQ